MGIKHRATDFELAKPTKSIPYYDARKKRKWQAYINKVAAVGPSWNERIKRLYLRYGRDNIRNIYELVCHDVLIEKARRIKRAERKAQKEAGIELQDRTRQERYYDDHTNQLMDITGADLLSVPSSFKSILSSASRRPSEQNSLASSNPNTSSEESLNQMQLDQASFRQHPGQRVRFSTAIESIQPVSEYAALRTEEAAMQTDASDYTSAKETSPELTMPACRPRPAKGKRDIISDVETTSSSDSSMSLRQPLQKESSLSDEDLDKLLSVDVNPDLAREQTRQQLDCEDISICDMDKDKDNEIKETGDPLSDFLNAGKDQSNGQAETYNTEATAPDLFFQNMLNEITFQQANQNMQATVNHSTLSLTSPKRKMHENNAEPNPSQDLLGQFPHKPVDLRAPASPSVPIDTHRSGRIPGCTRSPSVVAAEHEHALPLPKKQNDAHMHPADEWKPQADADFDGYKQGHCFSTLFSQSSSQEDMLATAEPVQDPNLVESASNPTAPAASMRFVEDQNSDIAQDVGAAADLDRGNDVPVNMTTSVQETAENANNARQLPGQMIEAIETTTIPADPSAISDFVPPAKHSMQTSEDTGDHHKAADSGVADKGESAIREYRQLSVAGGKEDFPIDQANGIAEEMEKPSRIKDGQVQQMEHSPVKPPMPVITAPATTTTVKTEAPSQPKEDAKPMQLLASLRLHRDVVKHLVEMGWETLEDVYDGGVGLKEMLEIIEELEKDGVIKKGPAVGAKATFTKAFKQFE